MSATTTPVERPPDPNVNFTYPLEADGLPGQELAEIHGLMRAVGAMDIHVTQWPCEEDTRPRDVQMRAAARLIIFGSLDSPSVEEAAIMAQDEGREVLVVARMGRGGDARLFARCFHPYAQLLIYDSFHLEDAANTMAAFARGERPLMPLNDPDPEVMRPYLY